LRIIFWDLYIIVNEQQTTLAQVWDGTNLKLTFRRTISHALLDRWLELLALMQTISMSDSDDSPIWLFHSSGVYSVSSFYGVINNGGIIPAHTSAVWKLHIPPRMHVFLWLLSNNKLLTRDNLQKQRKVDDLTCLFCNEQETVDHLFFCCVIAKHLWEIVSSLFNKDLGVDFESVARWWISENKNSVLNMFSTAVLWVLCIMRCAFRD
jgi:hypothetical protein